MAHQTLADHFETVNPEWQFAIRTHNPKVLIHFEPQLDGRWLAFKTRGKDFRILSPAVVVKMLNQALEQYLVVAGVNIFTKQRLTFERALVKAPVTAPKTLIV